MAKFFTVDRSNSLKAGDQLGLITDLSTTLKFSIDGCLTISELENAFARDYPSGISKHGQQYLFGYESLTVQSGHRDFVHVTPMVEAIVEQVRKANFPNLPSRMECMFACRSLEDAREFRTLYHGHPANIFEVESESYFLGDMKLLSIGGQVMNAFELAYKYWSGYHSDSPFIEVLIPLPATIGNQMI